MVKTHSIYGFTVISIPSKLVGLIPEDCYGFDSERKTLCVADGITRDFVDNTPLLKNLESAVKIKQKKYPSYARAAADICVSSFLSGRSLAESNKDIASYNRRILQKQDYLGQDFAGCTAAGVFIEGDNLIWQFIADSGIAIFDQNWDLKFKTPNEGPNSKGSIDKDVKEKYNSSFQENKGRYLIRKLYRNNPEEPLAYGALTGEASAEQYIREGMKTLEQGDKVVLFTDGVGDIIFPGGELNFSALPILRKDNPQLTRDFCKKQVANEGTLCVYDSQ